MSKRKPRAEKLAEELTAAQIALLEAAVAWENVGHHFYPTAGPTGAGGYEVDAVEERHWRKFSPSTVAALSRRKILRYDGKDRHGKRYEATDLGLDVFAELFGFHPW